MYTEILKIIEGGLNKDFKKVYSYAKLLIDKLTRDGDEKTAKLIERLMEREKPRTTVTMDELLTTPVDQESRMSIVDVEMPGLDSTPIILQKLTQTKINDFINSVKYQGKLKVHGIEASNTLLLYGPPGCGKSTVAKYISEKTGLPLVIARFDAIVSSLLGNTAKNIRKIFDFADSRPCILFLDEFDAIAKARDDQYELGELKRVINSLLQNIDAYSQNNILIAATNHPELLDKAIWRRFNAVIEIGLPHRDEIVGLLYTFTEQFHSNLFEDKKKLDKIAKLLEGKSPSDIKTILNNAMAQAIIKGDGNLSYEDILIDIFEFDNHGSVSMDKMIEFLNEHGVSQTSIAEKMDISIRQVRNYLIKENQNEDNG